MVRFSKGPRRRAVLREAPSCSWSLSCVCRRGPGSWGPGARAQARPVVPVLSGAARFLAGTRPARWWRQGQAWQSPLAYWPLSLSARCFNRPTWWHRVLATCPRCARGRGTGWPREPQASPVEEPAFLSLRCQHRRHRCWLWGWGHASPPLSPAAGGRFLGTLVCASPRGCREGARAGNRHIFPKMC